MKWILPAFLVILLSCVVTLNGDRPLNGKPLNKMVEHMKKIRNLMRNLEDDTSSSDDGSLSDESGSNDNESSEPNSSYDPNESGSNNGTETTAPTTLTTGIIIKRNRRAPLQVIGVNGFKKTSLSKILFYLFLYYFDYPIARNVRFILTFLCKSSLRNLQEVTNATASCTKVDPSDTDGNIKYECTADKINNLDIEQITIDPNMYLDDKLLKSESGDINFNEEAALAALNLQNQTKQVDNMYLLENGQLTVYPNKYFYIKGDIDGYKGSVGDNLVLVVYDNSTDPSTPQNVSCTVKSANDKNYEFRCTPEKSIKGNIYQSPMYFGNNAITLNMTGPKSDYLTFETDGGNLTNIRNNPIYRKSSSGLSGGAIAGIVIACAVVLIIASIIAMMLRKPVTHAKNSSSVIGLRTVDNYSE